MTAPLRRRAVATRPSAAALALACLVAVVVACGEPALPVQPLPDDLDQAASEPLSARTSVAFGVSDLTGLGHPDLRVEPLRAYLQSATGLPIVARVFDRPDALIAAVARSEVHVAMLSPLAYVRARQRIRGLRPLATATERGSPTYLGYFVVRRGSPRQSLESLRGATVAYVDRTSTSGYLYPRALLRSRGYDPGTFFSHAEFLGSHVEVVRAVARGDVEVGAVAQGFVDSASRLREPQSNEIEVIAKTARIPFDCFAAAPRTPLPIAGRVRRALLALDANRAAQSAVTATLSFGAFVRTSNTRYDGIAEQIALERADAPRAQVP